MRSVTREREVAILVFENLEDGMMIEEIIDQFPVSREEINAVLAFASCSLDKAPSY
jgi:uncharacterized protein (DUF433 family)